jgi:PAS domain S-box-containing protein
VTERDDEMAPSERELALRQRTAQFETLLNEAPIGVYLVDSDFRLRQVNPTALPVFGDIPGLIGRDFDQILHILWPQPLADEIVVRFRHTLATGEPYVVPELCSERADRGVMEYYEWQISRIPLPEGGYGVVCYFSDISGHVHTRQALVASAAALEEADRRKDEFLATLSHELRNPLAPIVNALLLLKSRRLPASQRSAARDLIDRQVQQLVRLVDDILDVSRITMGKLQLRVERVELASVVAQAVEMVAPCIQSSAHHLDVRLPSEPVVLDGDQVRLSQVLVNLLRNACKYTNMGGHLRLTADVEAREGRAAELVVRVADDGIGIPPEFLPRIFDRSSQVAPATDRSQGGLGIGLALVRGLVEMHRGTVTARSKGPDRGSEFEVRLPLPTADPAPRTPSSSRRTGARIRLGTLRILVVDDHRDAADALAATLHVAGHVTEKAHDGLQAVKAAERFRPDVIIMDIGMPKLNGYEACRRIRSHDWGSDMAIVALTGWGQEQDRRRAVEAGFDAHLTKPVDRATLTKLLASLSAGRKSPVADPVRTKKKQSAAVRAKKKQSA